MHTSPPPSNSPPPSVLENEIVLPKPNINLARLKFRPRSVEIFMGNSVLALVEDVAIGQFPPILNAWTGRARWLVTGGWSPKDLLIKSIQYLYV